MKSAAPQNSAFPPCPLALSLNLPCAFAPTALALATEHPLMSPQTLGTPDCSTLPLDFLAITRRLHRSVASGLKCERVSLG